MGVNASGYIASDEAAPMTEDEWTGRQGGAAGLDLPSAPSFDPMDGLYRRVALEMAVKDGGGADLVLNAANRYFAFLKGSAN